MKNIRKLKVIPNQKLSVSDQKLRSEILARPLLTTLADTNSKRFKSVQKIFTSSIPLPKEFNGKEIWKDFLVPAKNQAKCGSCWAFSTSSTLSDRFNIQSEGRLYIDLSATQMVLCNFQGKEFDVKHPEIDTDAESVLNTVSLKEGACQGNTLFDAWRYLTVVGTVLDSCVSYDKSLNSTFEFNSISNYEKDNMLPLCLNVTGRLGDMCSDVEYNTFTGVEIGTPARKFRSIRFYSLPNNEDVIKQEIYKYGPVTTGMDVYSSFYMFDPKTEVYEHDPAETNVVGGHAVEICGWLEKNGVPCWIIKNSWGSEWGIDGYFYMRRGNNNCKIEENVIVGVPDFFYPNDYVVSVHMDDTTETKELEDLRRKINTDTSMPAGGINPRTGYSRRIELTKPWISTEPIIDYTTLPNWDSFIAGKVVGKKQKKTKVIYISIFIFLLVLCLIYFFLIKKDS